MIKAVILDFDGVILESVDIKTHAFARLFQAEDANAVRLILEYHRQNSGVSRFEKFKYIYAHIFKRVLTDDIFQSLCDKFSLLVIEEVIRAEFVKGAKEFLDNHDRSYDLYIASATPKSELDLIIDRRSMTRYFKEVFGAPRSKASAIHEIMTKMRITSDEIVFVGDALSDYEAAVFYRVHFIARVGIPDTIFSNHQFNKVPDLSNLAALIDHLHVLSR